MEVGPHIVIRGPFKIKNTIICGKGPKKEGGVRAKIKKDSLWLRGWGLNFSDFSQIQKTKIWPSLNACCLPAWLLPSLILMIYETAIGEIYATFSTYMAYIWMKYSPLSVCYDLGTVWASFRGVQRYQNSVHLKIFPISVEGGGSLKINFFPNSKKSKLSWGWVVKKIMDFFHQLCFFLFWTVP